MVIKLVSDFQLISYAWDFSNLGRNGWYEMKLGTYIKWGMLSPNMVMIKLVTYIGWNEMKLGTYIKWGMLSPNMVMKLDSDCQLMNYAWDLSNPWRSCWNEMKLGTYIKWGMLSPNMVIKLVSDFQLISYAWDLSNLWRSG